MLSRFPIDELRSSSQELRMANAAETNMNRESPQKSQNSNNFETLDKATVNTLKRNPKIEFCKTDLLKLLTYLEGELQARDVAIATLKSEKLKQYLVQSRHVAQYDSNDPVVALQRDNFAVVDHSRDGADMCLYVNHQLNSLENLVIQQRRSQARVARVIKEAEIRHRNEIEVERQNREKYEKEYLKLNEVLEAEKNKHKQIVLFLLAERKKIIMKYVEERKRSEDLAQILAEEKGRVDAMAEGLEEESKKSLQMEAELEKQLAQFYVDTQQLRATLAKQEKKSNDLEIELEKSQKENLLLRQQLTEIRSHYEKSIHPSSNAGTLSSVPQLPIGSESIPPPPLNVNAVNANLQCSIAKVIQPTATVSSVPVSGPMTGIARSVSPGKHPRFGIFAPVSSNSANVNSNKSNDPVVALTQVALVNMPDRTIATSASVRSATIANSPHPKLASSPIAKNLGGESSSVSTVIRKSIPLGRGVPPPVPPNKPVVPPKKDGILNRKLDASVSENLDKNVQKCCTFVEKDRQSSATEKHDDQV